MHRTDGHSLSALLPMDGAETEGVSRFPTKVKQSLTFVWSVMNRDFAAAFSACRTKVKESLTFLENPRPPSPPPGA